jgi:hypothetical protein
LSLFLFFPSLLVVAASAGFIPFSHSSGSVGGGGLYLFLLLLLLLNESILYIKKSFLSAVSQRLHGGHCREFCGSLQAAQRITLHYI